MRSSIAMRAGALVSLTLAAAAAVASADVTLNDCGGFTEFTRIPGLGTFPDNDTLVYQAPYAANPFVDTVIHGSKPPQVRYWSFAIIDQTRYEIANLSDFQIALNADGSYDVAISVDCSSRPYANCLQVKPVDCISPDDPTCAVPPDAPALVYYRLYVSDGDEAGGAGVPTVTYRRVRETTTDVAAPIPDDTCRALLAALTGEIQPGSTGGEALADSPAETPVCNPGAIPPASPSASRGGQPGEAQLETLEADGVPTTITDLVRTARNAAGFGATHANAYESILYDMADGNVVLHAKAPTYRHQHAAANPWSRSDGTEQVRYWSLCTTQAAHPVDCRRDETIVPDADGESFTVIVSPTCPVDGYANCLRSGVTGVTGLGGAPFLLYRNTLPAAGFYNEHGPLNCPNASSVFCGPYGLGATYVARDCPL